MPGKQQGTRRNDEEKSDEATPLQFRCRTGRSVCLSAGRSVDCRSVDRRSTRPIETARDRRPQIAVCESLVRKTRARVADKQLIICSGEDTGMVSFAIGTNELSNLFWTICFDFVYLGYKFRGYENSMVVLTRHSAVYLFVLTYRSLSYDEKLDRCGYLVGPGRARRQTG